MISVIITSYNDTGYLDNLLVDLSNQNISGLPKIEILILEAGNASEDRIRKYLGKLSDNLRYWAISGLSRTHSLNFLVSKSNGRLVVRLDARSGINSDYLEKIYELSLSKNCANVGGVMVPMGKTHNQKLIARFMQHPLAFGGAKFRNESFSGYVDSVYLGAFNKDYMPKLPWFDENNPRISEDSDLNFRLKRSGQAVYMDSSIQVKHYPRENMKAFFKLCFNYGVGRGLFMLKNKTLSSQRQFVLPLSFVLSSILLFLGTYIPLFNYILLLAGFFYLVTVALISATLGSGLKEIFYFLVLFFGCHLSWTIGFFLSPLINITNKNDTRKV
jgi:succinoglycan biosynthesis protein ExoA